MKVQKITAKLRDAVPVCFMVDGEEAAQYKNIDLPDSIKELEMNDFGFNMAADGKISFHILLDAGILPQPLTEPRAKLTRAEKAAMKAANAEAIVSAAPEAEEADAAPCEEAIEEAETAPSEEAAEETEAAPSEEVTEEAEPSEEAAEQPATMELAFNVTGERRKELVEAVSGYTHMESNYKAAPTFAYEVADYTIDKNGTLTGEYDAELIKALARQGFIEA